MQLKKLIHLEFDIIFKSGTRISGGGGGLEIGGTVDANLAVLRDPVSGEPYIPGSSLKGKLRSIAEKVADKIAYDGGPCRCGGLDCPICPVFGAHMNTRGAPSAPTRITVRDAFFTGTSRAKWEEEIGEAKERLEQKSEVAVGRISGTGGNPRTGERVPPGAAFHAHLILHIYDRDLSDTDSKESTGAKATNSLPGSAGVGACETELQQPARAETYVETISNALKNLEEGESIGASGSRGYGEVKLDNLTRREDDVKGLRVNFQTVTSGQEAK